MRIGASLVLIAIGAVLKWAVDYEVTGVRVTVVGTILLVVGLIGLAITLVMWGTRRRGDVDVIREERDPLL